MMSIFGASFAPAYAASKGGIVQFTRSCAVAWAADNIQANAVLPGWIDTDLTKRAREQIDGLHDRVLARTPAARWGAIADFAGIAVFLARRVGLRHRHRDSRRWRIFGHGIDAARAPSANETARNKKAPDHAGLLSFLEKKLDQYFATTPGELKW